ncbi:hypothetical protein ACO2SS_24670, partial [Enterovirga sp. CN4-39]
VTWHFEKDAPLFVETLGSTIAALHAIPRAAAIEAGMAPHTVSDAETAALRDYYRVEDEKGRRFWLFRNAPAPEGTRWWLHGRFA